MENKVLERKVGGGKKKREGWRRRRRKRRRRIPCSFSFSPVVLAVIPERASVQSLGN